MAGVLASGTTAGGGMGDEMVKFSNDFNERVVLRGFEAIHLDLLMAIASKVVNRRSATVSFTFAELRELTGVRWNMTTAEFAGKIEQMNDRLIECNFKLERVNAKGQHVKTWFTLFDQFDLTEEAQTLEVAVRPCFVYLFNDLRANFTVMELAEFVGLHSTYAKECYRRLRQYRSTGFWHVTLPDFYRLMHVPAMKTKTAQTTYLNRKVLKPIQDELGPLLDLRIEKIYAWPENAPRRGRQPLAALNFHFRKEPKPRMDDTQRAAMRRRQREQARANEWRDIMAREDLEQLPPAPTREEQRASDRHAVRWRAHSIWLRDHNLADRITNPSTLSTQQRDAMDRWADTVLALAEQDFLDQYNHAHGTRLTRQSLPDHDTAYQALLEFLVTTDLGQYTANPPERETGQTGGW